MHSGERNNGKVEITEIILGAEIADFALDCSEDSSAAVSDEASSDCSEDTNTAVSDCRAESVGGAATRSAEAAANGERRTQPGENTL